MVRVMRTSLKRGTTFVETVIALAISSLLIGSMAVFSGWLAPLLPGAMARADAQQQTLRAVQGMTQDIRKAMQLAAGADLIASPPVLALQMPQYDVSGNLVLPRTAGNVVTYALSPDRHRITRQESNVGTIVVAQVDSNSQLQISYSSVTVDTNGNGLFDLNEYVSITPAITATCKIGSGTSAYDSTFRLSQQQRLRNR